MSLKVKNALLTAVMVAGLCVFVVAWAWLSYLKVTTLPWYFW